MAVGLAMGLDVGTHKHYRQASVVAIPGSQVVG